METNKENLIYQLEQGQRDTLPLTGEEMAELYLSMKTKLEQKEKLNAELSIRYAGVIGLLADLSGHYLLAGSEDREDAIERVCMAADGWCEWSGWSYQIVGHKLSLWPPVHGEQI